MRSSKQGRNRWVAIVLVAATASGRAVSQEVRDLTNSDPTEEQLIEILKPKTDPNDLGGARGFGVKERVKCSLRDTGGTRKVGLKPLSDVAAIRVHFAFNSTAILPEASRALDTLGKALASQALASSCFQIKGHTDSVGSDSYNDRLSQERAAAVVRYLSTHFGIGSDRLESVGFGERLPLADNSSEEGRSKNRRVEIVNVGS
jgi:outer membrane protein OmpA-like peptidoglycan-associated protein